MNHKDAEAFMAALDKITPTLEHEKTGLVYRLPLRRSIIMRPNGYYFQCPNLARAEVLFNAYGFPGEKKLGEWYRVSLAKAIQAQAERIHRTVVGL